MGMRFYFNPNDIVSAVRSEINSDVILQGSGYLDGTLNIFSMRLPEECPDRVLLIEVSNMIPNEMQEYYTEIRVHSFVPLLINNQIDPIANTILERCEQLLNNASLTISNAKCNGLMSDGIIPAYYVKDDILNKGHGILRLTGRIHPN